jgi:hypothetical protein
VELQSLWDNVERHVARQHVAGRGHGDVTRRRANGDRGSYKGVGNDREARRGSVEHYTSCSGESLPENTASLANFASGVDKSHERAEAHGETIDDANVLGHASIGSSTVEVAICALSHPTGRVTAVTTSVLCAEAIKRRQRSR